MNKLLFMFFLFVVSGFSAHAMQRDEKLLCVDNKSNASESQLSFFRLSQRLELSTAKMFLARTQSTFMVHELLYAILTANFSFTWVQKCDLIDIVRNRLDTNPRMRERLDRIERQLLLGHCIHGLTLEELADLQTRSDL